MLILCSRIFNKLNFIYVNFIYINFIYIQYAIKGIKMIQDKDNKER